MSEALERVRLNSPYGFATGKNADGSRHLSNGATGVVVGGRWNDNLRVLFDYPDDGTYDLPSHWFTPASPVFCPPGATKTTVRLTPASATVPAMIEEPAR